MKEQSPAIATGGGSKGGETQGNGGSGIFYAASQGRGQRVEKNVGRADPFAADSNGD